MDKHLNDSYKLRLPPEMKERIAESAKAHNRSMNADIIARLEKSFSESAAASEDAASLDEMRKEMHQLLAEARQMRMYWADAVNRMNDLARGAK